MEQSTPIILFSSADFLLGSSTALYAQSAPTRLCHISKHIEYFLSTFTSLITSSAPTAIDHICVRSGLYRHAFVPDLSFWIEKPLDRNTNQFCGDVLQVSNRLEKCFVNLGLASVNFQTRECLIFSPGCPSNVGWAISSVFCPEFTSWIIFKRISERAGFRGVMEGAGR